MKQEIRFLDCIERDLKSRKKKSVILGIISVISFFVGVIVIPCCTIKNVVMDLNKLWLIIIISALIAWVPAIFSIPQILVYIRRRQNKKDWNEITKRFSLNEEITLYTSKLKNHIFKKNDSDILSNLFIELLCDDEIKMIITQGDESDREVNIIYILSNGLTVTEKFLCFDKDKVMSLMSILNIW